MQQDTTSQSIQWTDSSDYDDYDTIDSTNSVSLLHSTFAVSAVFSIAAVSAPDLVSYINQNAGGYSITPGLFATAAAFSSSFTYNVSPTLDATVEYAFLTNSYQFGDPGFGGYNFSYDVHRFVAVVHRTFNHDFYGVAVGAGVGYTYGVFRQVTPTASGGEQFTASGGNVLAEAVLRSSFGGHFYLRIDLQAFAAFTNVLNNNGSVLYTGAPPHQKNITLGSFGGDVGIGLEYFF